MSKSILDEFDASMPQKPNLPGGVTSAKDLPYSPPVGPSGINDPKTPGIHGTNHGNNGSQGSR